MSESKKTQRPGPAKPSSAPAPSTATTAPQLRFLFQVDAVEPANGSQMAPVYRDWLPPVRTNGYISPADGCSTPWYLWTPSHMAVALNGPEGFPEQTVPCNSTTLFWDFRTDRYIGVPIDCRAQNVDQMNAVGEDLPANWSTLRFQYIKKDGVDLTRVGFFGLHEGLGAPASEDWMPQLIPYTSALPPTLNPEQDGNAKLVGRMSLLVALAAMSCDFQHISEVMTRSFKPPHWHSHDFSSGRQYHRGVIVQVRRYANARSLEPWELGDRGPLISGINDPSPDDDEEQEPMQVDT